MYESSHQIETYVFSVHRENKVQMFPFFIDVKISVRSNQRGNQKWITQRNWRHWTDKTQDEDKQNKTKSTQKTKARSNMDHTKNRGVNRSAHERQAFASNKTSTIILISSICVGHQYMQIIIIRNQLSYKQLEEMTNRIQFLCEIHSGHHNTELRM